MICKLLWILEFASYGPICLQELNGKIVGNNRTLLVSEVIPRTFEKNNKAAVLPHTTQETKNPSQESDVTESANNNEAGDDSDSVPNGSVTKAKSARDAVTPLAHMEYSEQLEHKKSSLMQILKKLVKPCYDSFLFFSLCTFINYAVY